MSGFILNTVTTALKFDSLAKSYWVDISNDNITIDPEP